MKHTTKSIGPEPTIPETLSDHVSPSAVPFVLLSLFLHTLKPHSSPHSYLLGKTEATWISNSSDHTMNKLSCAHIFRFPPHSWAREERGVPPGAHSPLFLVQRVLLHLDLPFPSWQHQTRLTILNSWVACFCWVPWAHFPLVLLPRVWRCLCLSLECTCAPKFHPTFSSLLSLTSVIFCTVPLTLRSPFRAHRGRSVFTWRKPHRFPKPVGPKLLFLQSPLKRSTRIQVQHILVLYHLLILLNSSPLFPMCLDNHHLYLFPCRYKCLNQFYCENITYIQQSV